MFSNCPNELIWNFQKSIFEIPYELLETFAECPGFVMKGDNSITMVIIIVAICNMQ